MYRRQSHKGRQRGQMIMLFALSLTAILLVVGLVIDGGYALVQRRSAQNAADFAALAGARIVAEKVGGDATNGTDANVQAAIVNSILVNKATPITFGSPDGPAVRQFSRDGDRLGRCRRRDPDGRRRRHDEGRHHLEAVLPWRDRRVELEGVRCGNGEGRILPLADLRATSFPSASHRRSSTASSPAPGRSATVRVTRATRRTSRQVD